MNRIVSACVVLLIGTHTVVVYSAPFHIITPVADNEGTVFVVDAQGNRQVLSLAPNIGAGPALHRSSSIALGPNGEYLVAQVGSPSALFSVSPITGDRTLISALSMGTGPIFNPETVLVTPDGRIIVINQGDTVAGGFVIDVDLATGNRTLISGLGTGSGPVFDTLGGGVLDVNGNLIVADKEQEVVFRVDLSSGERSILSGAGVGLGPALNNPADVAVALDGSIIASTIDFSDLFNVAGVLLRIDPITGDREIIAAGSIFDDFLYERIVIAPDGRLLGSALDSIYLIDLENGTREVRSSATVGTGPELFAWGDMLVVIVPEPSTAVLASCSLLCVTGVLARNCLRRRRQKPSATTHKETSLHRRSAYNSRSGSSSATSISESSVCRSSSSWARK